MQWKASPSSSRILSSTPGTQCIKYCTFLFDSYLSTESLAQELEMERKSRQQAMERDVKSPLSDRASYYKNSVLFSSATQLTSTGATDLPDNQQYEKDSDDTRKPIISVKPEFREKQVMSCKKQTSKGLPQSIIPKYTLVCKIKFIQLLIFLFSINLSVYQDLDEVFLFYFEIN